jgi:hypothetical protein
MATGKYQSLGFTGAFNWQQGSMLQWKPLSKDSAVLFNDRLGDRFGAVVLDIQSGRRETLPSTIYSVAPNGEFTISPRYERLYYCRPGYCYMGIEQPKWNKPLPPGDGLVLMDLLTGDTRLIVETAELASRTPGAKGATHYLEHVMVGPDSSRFVFVHRWYRELNSGVTRFYGASLDGATLHLYDDSGFYSHANWIDKDQVLVWCRKLGMYARARRSVKITRFLLWPALAVYRKFSDASIITRVKDTLAKDAFFICRWDGAKPAIVGGDTLTSDGHPSVCPTDRDLIVVDTYDDPEHWRSLLLYNMHTDVAVRLGRFASPAGVDRTGFRCDLHPRWSPCGKRICVDVFRGARRQVVVLDVSAVKGEIV